jgi:hypothetical protein
MDGEGSTPGRRNNVNKDSEAKERKDLGKVL